jgi:hypothetical protein
MEFKNQKELFRWCWDNRPHVSEISGTPLGNEMNVWFFAHVLPKGSYGLFKLKNFNITLLTPQEHTLYDHQTHKAKLLPEFNWLFEYRLHLTQKYNAIQNPKLYSYPRSKN